MEVSGVRPTKAIVHLDNIAENVRIIRQNLSVGTEMMAVVKANGYGHGAVPVAQAALKAGASWLGVALAEEGVQLRQAGITAPVLILGQSWDGQIALAVEHGLDLTVFDLDTLRLVESHAKAREMPASVHVKIDTGMGRVGMVPSQWNKDWLDALHNSQWLRWRGLMTHFAESDAPDAEFTRYQLSQFLDVIERTRMAGELPPYLHAANSAAALRYPGTHFNLVRVGIALYGGIVHPQLKPGLTWQSQIVYLKKVAAGTPIGYGRTYRTPKPMQIATIPVGYADGYRRDWSNRASVIINRQCYPVVGRVSMDQITVGLPLTAPVRVGDRVLMMGEQGACAMTAMDLAELAHTISYEVLVGIGSRVLRQWDPPF